MTILSERLKKLRIENNLTQQDIADKLNITRNAYSHWENAKREPNSEKLQKLALKLGTTTDYLLGKTDFPGFIYYDGSENKEFPFNFTLYEADSSDNNESKSPHYHTLINKDNDDTNSKPWYVFNGSSPDSILIPPKFEAEFNDFLKKIKEDSNNLETTHSKSDKTDDNEKY